MVRTVADQASRRNLDRWRRAGRTGRRPRSSAERPAGRCRRAIAGEPSEAPPDLGRGEVQMKLRTDRLAGPGLGGAGPEQPRRRRRSLSDPSAAARRRRDRRRPPVAVAVARAGRFRWSVATQRPLLLSRGVAGLPPSTDCCPALMTLLDRVCPPFNARLSRRNSDPATSPFPQEAGEGRSVEGPRLKLSPREITVASR